MNVGDRVNHYAFGDGEVKGVLGVYTLVLLDTGKEHYLATHNLKVIE